jgi:hypothetical protein
MNQTGALSKSAWRGTNAIESWSWKGCENRKTTVEVYADCAYIELSLNGKLLGRKKAKQYRAMFKVRYLPGTLTAAAIGADGKEQSRATLESSSGPLRITAVPETTIIKEGQLVYVQICITGENGIVESNADDKLTVLVDGGKLLAFGSANPRTTERYTDGVFTTFYGRALAVVAVDNPDSFKIAVSGLTRPLIKWSG